MEGDIVKNSPSYFATKAVLQFISPSLYLYHVYRLKIKIMCQLISYCYCRSYCRKLVFNAVRFLSTLLLEGSRL